MGEASADTLRQKLLLPACDTCQNVLLYNAPKLGRDFDVIFDMISSLAVVCNTEILPPVRLDEYE